MAKAISLQTNFVEEIKIAKFDGGITSDPRDPSPNVSNVVTGFDVLTNPTKMTPYRASKDGDGSSSTNQIQNFCLAKGVANSEGNWWLFGLGVRTGLPTKARIFYKELTTVAAGLGDNVWTGANNGQSGNTSVNVNMFCYYKRVGLIFGTETDNIFSFDPTELAQFNTSQHALTFTSTTQAIVHSADDYMYFGYYDSVSGTSAIASNQNGSWKDTALTLPQGFMPTAVTEFGNLLAIAIVPVSGIGNSRVILWNRDITQGQYDDNIDFGSGSIMILRVVDGVLIAISQRGGSPFSFANIPAGSTSFQDRVIFRLLNGTKSEKFKEIIGGNATTVLPIASQVLDNRLYFSMSISLNGATREGIWSIGRSSPSQPFSLMHERTPNNDTPLTGAAKGIFGFFLVDDYLFQSYKTNAAFAMSKTDNTATYASSTSIFESKRYDFGDASLKKKLDGVTVKMEYMPAAGSVVVKFRTDQNTTWTTALTDTTDNDISASAVLDLTGKALPEFKEIEFRLESTGGAEITGFSAKASLTGKRQYE